MEFDPIICRLADALVPAARAEKILLFSEKRSLDGTLQSCKLCVVAPTDNRAALLRTLYLQVDCPVPFDLVLYTPEEWQTLCNQPDSFACRVAAAGRVLYG